MSFWGKLLGRSAPREPTCRESLEAHLEALRDRFAQPSDAKPAQRPGLPVLNSEGVTQSGGHHRVVVQTGLDRVEVSAPAPNRFSINVSCEGFLSETLAHAKQRRDRLARLTLSRSPDAASFSRDLALPAGGFSALAREVERVLFDLFEHPADIFYSVAIERSPTACLRSGRFGPRVFVSSTSCEPTRR